MEQHIDFGWEAMAKSQEQLARIIQSESFVVLHMSRLIRAIPPKRHAQESSGPNLELSQEVAKQIASYLLALADLEDATADQLKVVVKELRVSEEE